MLDVEVWEQQLGKGIVIAWSQAREEKQWVSFSFSEEGNESTDFHDLIGKAECFQVSICGKGANNLQYLAYREGKRDCFCSYSYRVLLRSNLSSKYLQALHRHHLLLLDRSVALFSTKGGFLCPGDMWRHLKAFWLSRLAGWMLLVSGD